MCRRIGPTSAEGQPSDATEYVPDELLRGTRSSDEGGGHGVQVTVVAAKFFRHQHRELIHDLVGHNSQVAPMGLALGAFIPGIHQEERFPDPEVDRRAPKPPKICRKVLDPPLNHGNDRDVHRGGDHRRSRSAPLKDTLPAPGSLRGNPQKLAVSQRRYRPGHGPSVRATSVDRNHPPHLHDETGDRILPEFPLAQGRHRPPSEKHVVDRPLEVGRMICHENGGTLHRDMIELVHPYHAGNPEQTPNCSIEEGLNHRHSSLVCTFFHVDVDSVLISI
jgi:hypothetical protein